jgi:hypothetical protein
MSGFHNQCKSYKFKKIQAEQNDAQISKLENLVNKMSLNNTSGHKELVTVEYRPPPFWGFSGYPGSPYGPWGYPYPPPLALKHHEQSEDEDDV